MPCIYYRLVSHDEDDDWRSSSRSDTVAITRCFDFKALLTFTREKIIFFYSVSLPLSPSLSLSLERGDDLASGV